MKIRTGLMLTAVTLAVLAGCSGKKGDPGEVVFVPTPEPTPIPEDTFPNGSWKLTATGTGSFIGSVLNVSNDGTNLSFYNYNTAGDVYFDDACFGNAPYGNNNSISGTVANDGTLSGALKVAISAHPDIEANRIVYRKAVGSVGTMVVDFYDNVGEVESTMTATYLGEVASAEALASVSNKCSEPSAGVFKAVTNNGEQSPIFLDLQFNRSVIVHRTRQVDYNTSCRLIDAAGSWTNISNTTVLDIGDGNYTINTTLASNPSVLSAAGELTLTRATKAEFLAHQSTQNCVDSELISLNFLFLPPKQFATAAAFDYYGELVYDVVINGASASGNEDSVALVSDVPGAHVITGILFDSLKSYTASIEVYRIVGNTRVKLASRTLATAMGGDAPFAPVPDNVEIIEGTETITIGDVVYVITGDAAYNVVNGDGYNVYFDADFDGIWNYIDDEPVTINQ